MDGGRCAEPGRSAARGAFVDVCARPGRCGDPVGPRKLEKLARAHRSPPEHAGDDLGPAARTGGGGRLKPRAPPAALAALIPVLAVAGPAVAEVKSVTPNGFEVASTATQRGLDRAGGHRNDRRTDDARPRHRPAPRGARGGRRRRRFWRAEPGARRDFRHLLSDATPATTS